MKNLIKTTLSVFILLAMNKSYSCGCSELNLSQIDAKKVLAFIELLEEKSKERKKLVFKMPNRKDKDNQNKNLIILKFMENLNQ